MKKPEPKPVARAAHAEKMKAILDAPKPTPNERKAATYTTTGHEKLSEILKKPLTWQCAICGGLTDLLVCPIDGNVSP